MRIARQPLIEDWQAWRPVASKFRNRGVIGTYYNAVQHYRSRAGSSDWTNDLTEKTFVLALASAGAIDSNVRGAKLLRVLTLTAFHKMSYGWLLS
jgi:hypothetical protein